MIHLTGRAGIAALLAALYPCPNSRDGQHHTQGGAVCCYCKKAAG